MRTTIVDVLNDEAQTQLDDTRHSAHNFAMLVESLLDQLAQDKKALKNAKIKASVKGFSEGLKALAEAMQRLARPRAFRRS